MTDTPGTPVEPTLEAGAVLDVKVRLWAELGRARMPIGRAVALGEGSIVDLDRKPEAPVDVYVNGSHFGTGRLILVDGEWALQLETVRSGDGVEQASSPSSETG
jgi:flagellar motor switch protein FliN/FliY